jgi:hypothetical protein
LEHRRLSSLDFILRDVAAATDRRAATRPTEDMDAGNFPLCFATAALVDVTPWRIKPNRNGVEGDDDCDGNNGDRDKHIDAHNETGTRRETL